MLKKLFRFVFSYLLLLGLIGGFFYFFPHIWSPPLVQQIEKHLSKALGGPVKLKRARISRVWPLTFSLEEIRFESAEKSAVGEITAVRLSTSLATPLAEWHRPRFALALELEGPALSFVLPDMTGAEVKPAQGAGTRINLEAKPGAVVPDIELHFSLKNGAITLGGPGLGRDAAVEKLAIEFGVPSVRSREIKPTLEINGEMVLGSGELAIKAPVKISAGEVVINETEVKVSKGLLSVANIVADLEGHRQWEQGVQSWRAVLRPADLSTLPVPPSFLPPGKWSGGFSGEVTYRRDQSDAAGRLSGSVQTNSLQGEVELERGGARIRGLARGQLRSRFSYVKSFAIEDISAFVDLTDAELTYGSYFHKAIKGPFTVDVVTDGDTERLQFRRGRLKVDPLVVDWIGTLGLGEKSGSEVTVTILPVSCVASSTSFPLWPQLP